MTDQPTKWGVEINEDVIYLQRGQNHSDLVTFCGPDREANAKLFIDAQQFMPELVETAQDIAGDYQSSKFHHPHHVLISIVKFEALCAILAKMKGQR